MGKYFKSTEELYEILGGFFETLKDNEEIATKLKKTGILIKFGYTDPEGEIWIDLRDKLEFHCGKPEDWGEPDVVMVQSCDFSHSFWHGFENPIAAIAKRKITATGSVPKALQLLPAIKPTYKLYPEYLKKIGREDLVLHKKSLADKFKKKLKKPAK